MMHCARKLCGLWTGGQQSWQLLSITKRLYCLTSKQEKVGLILTYNKDENNDNIDLSAVAKEVDDSVSGAILKQLMIAGPAPKTGGTRSIYGAHKTYPVIEIVNTGNVKCQVGECRDEIRENIRAGISAAAQHLREHSCTKAIIDPAGNADAAAEGATLGLFSFDELKAEKKRKKHVEIDCYDTTSKKLWEGGCKMAEGQNMARRLAEMPSNILTPLKFGEIAAESLNVFKRVNVQVHDKDWATDKKMGAFLSVSQGSAEPPAFLEISYKSKDGDPYVLVGKGVTFDTGGISIKPPGGMDAMRGDMGGAACVLSAIVTCASLELPLNVVALIPLCENMPGGRATRPGDVVTAMNGTTIQVDNTDAEGRLILADALCYADTFNPRGVMDVATLTGAMRVALGGAATGVFTNCDESWSSLARAAHITGDRVWRMPLFRRYSDLMTSSHLADINNISTNSAYGGGACTAAAFLQHFTKCKSWMHLDIAGVMDTKGGDSPYLVKGMTGRPTRTIVQFLKTLQ